MIDFKEEVSKYQPVSGLDDVEKAVNKDEIRDIMDMLQYIARQITVATEKE